MDAVKAFNEELSGIYEAKPPISRAKMTQLTKKAIKGIKFYKHIVQSMEKFVQKCRPEYKVPGLYVIDSVVRQSRHQFGPEKDVFMPRLCKNIITTFQHIFKCPVDDKPRILRVLNLWQKNAVFPPEIIQQLMVMAGAPTPDTTTAGASIEAAKKPAQSTQPDATNLTNLLANLLANPDPSQIQNLAGLLSSSQQSQLEDLLKQVKGTDQWQLIKSEKDELELVWQNESSSSSVNHNENTTVFQPQQNNEQPPFLHSSQEVESRPPAFNRDVLDFDYSDDDQTPPSKSKPSTHSHGIDPSLLAKLPTADQIQQLTESHSNTPNNHTGLPSQHQYPPPPPPHRGEFPPGFEQMKRLEQQQEIFNKQIQQISETSDRSSSLQASDRSENHKRRRSRSRSHDRHHRHHRRRSRSRDGHRSKRSRSHDRSRRSRRSRSKSYDRRKERKGFPPIKDGCISVCTTTLWIGNISAKVMQHDLQQLVEEYGEFESLNMIPPRGCAYVCMKKRNDADKALQKIRHARLAGKSLKCEWAPGKEMPEEEKLSYSKEHGVNYIPLSSDPNQLRALSTWGTIDPESLPEHRRVELTALESSTNEDIQETPEPTPPPAMVSTFANPAVSMMSGVRMVARPQVPMMVRPFQVGPFGVPPQRMGFQPRPPVQQVVNKPPDVSSEAGNLTPTADEQDEGFPPQASVARFQAPFGAVQVARGFPGPMPLQVRMMPGMGQQIMPQRMGVMPIRMGIPMQLRPGFHSGMQRIPVQGGAQMLPNHMQQQQRQQLQQLQPQAMRPQRFPRVGVMRMPLPGQIRPAISSAGPIPGRRFPLPQQLLERRGLSDMDQGPEEMEVQMNEDQAEVKMERFGGGPPRGFDRPASTERRFEPPAREIPPPELGRRPSGFDQGRPEGERLPQDINRPPRDTDGPPRDLNRPPRDVDRPTRDMNRPPRDSDRPPRDSDRPPRDLDRPPRDLDRPSRDIDRPPRDIGRSRDRPDFDRSRRDRSPDRDRRDLDRDRRGRDYRRGGRDFERGRRNFDRDRGGRDRDYNGRDRGPPFRSFRGRDDRGHRGMDRGGFRGRGRGGWGDDRRRRSPPLPKPDDEEYNRKRQETLRKRHEEDEDYVPEKVDLSEFGLPSGFGGLMENSEKGESDKNDDERSAKGEGDKNDDERSAKDGKSGRSSSRERKFSDDAARNRRDWLEEQQKKPKKNSDDESSEKLDAGPGALIQSVPKEMKESVLIKEPQPDPASNSPTKEMNIFDKRLNSPLANMQPSPADPTTSANDEQPEEGTFVTEVNEELPQENSPAVQAEAES
ncbi:uncharacterized protein LOC143470165 isoform X3 [Clavelina lepadiformis]|uniref:uncharacterized protein LOC143470165 isoform X3 n=1 Tax=Clavelina lepadiformis TaxID=159417 RepID=UPI0040411B53